MKHARFVVPLPLVAATLAVGGVQSSAAPAPVAPVRPKIESPVPSLFPVPARVVITVPLHYVSASLMGWWLDQEHNPYPPELLADGATPPQTQPSKRAGGFALSQGVESVIGDVNLKQMRITGTEAGCQSVLEIVRILDRPLRQINFHTVLLRINEAELQELGAQPSSPPDAKVVTYATPEAFEDRLADAAVCKHVTILSVSRNTAINNLSLVVTQLAPSIKADPLSAKTDPLALPLPDLTITPTINNDGTITLLIGFAASAQDAPKSQRRNGFVLLSATPERDADSSQHFTKIVQVLAITRPKSGVLVRLRAAKDGEDQATFALVTPTSIIKQDPGYALRSIQPVPGADSIPLR